EAMKLFEKNELVGDRWGIRVNKYGFRGPEIEEPKKGIRIMALGDSCTFGWVVGDDFTYPAVMQRTLRKMGYDVEVINAGVEGYTAKDILKRLDYYLSFNPDVVTIYVGWNEMYKGYNTKESSSEKKPSKLENYSAAFFIIKKSLSKLLKTGEYAERKVYYDKNDKEAQRAENYTPPFINDVTEIVERVREKDAVPVVITLAGLFLADRQPSQESIDLKHLPPFTDNAYAFARMASNYNNLLRRYARRNSVHLIDLDRWSYRAFREREKWFFDSVHPVAAGQVEIGEHIASELQNVFHP
ncbi:MAG: SGNH/GDSL hydrolase family protein, partial [bacterium]